MSILEALLLGIIQGLTEFLPVSSSGHLELGKVLLGIETADDATFTVLVHGATVLSTIVVFRQQIAELLKNLFGFQWNPQTEYIAKLAVAAIPVGLVGVFLKDEVESLFTGNALLVGSMLLVTGCLLAFTYYAPKEGKEVGFGTGFLIGIAQALAVLPGISRSGATIAIGLLLGVDKGKVAAFSFLVVLAPILGANLLDIMDGELGKGTTGAIPLLVGFFAAFISGLLACKWMIALVTKGKLIYFAIYCFVIGGVSIVGHYLL